MFCFRRRRRFGGREKKREEVKAENHYSSSSSSLARLLLSSFTSDTSKKRRCTPSKPARASRPGPSCLSAPRRPESRAEPLLLRSSRSPRPTPRHPCGVRRRSISSSPSLPSSPTRFCSARPQPPTPRRRPRSALRSWPGSRPTPLPACGSSRCEKIRVVALNHQFCSRSSGSGAEWKNPPFSA